MKVLVNTHIPLKLQAFEGPLDLLLHLLDKNKMNIFDIPIVEITKQYLDYIHSMQEKNLEVMSEFLVMAATLLKIKSQMLLPRQEPKEEEPTDPRAELVERLLEYKMYRYASIKLKDMQIEAQKEVFKKPSIPKECNPIKQQVLPQELLAGISLPKLQQIFESVMKRREDKIDPIRSKFGTIEKETVTLSEKVLKIQEFGLSHRTFKFTSLLSKKPRKMDVIVTFLGILELMKMGRLKVHQQEQFDDLDMEYLADDIIAVEEWDR